MSAVAITEHGGVSSHVPLEKATLTHGIKPLYGCEFYTAPDLKSRRKWHLTVIAENSTGYRNLLRLSSLAFSDGFYYFPTITGKMLAEHSEGLIVLSGCSDSKLACDLLGGKGRDVLKRATSQSEREAYETAARFKELLGDRYYLECQQFPELDRSCVLNQYYESISHKLGIKLAASSDCHYPFPKDNDMQKILHAAGRNLGTVEAAEAQWEYDILMTYPDSDRGIYDRLRATGLSRDKAIEAIVSTEEIAQRCNVELPKTARLRYPIIGRGTAKELIWQWLREGWLYRIQVTGNRALVDRREDYHKRLTYEMSIIEEKDFVDYFLMLGDAVKYAKDSGIVVGPARGSAASSLTLYLLRITEIDPLQFPLMSFERFIDINRSDIPDVDLDFDDVRRDEVRQHLVNTYGSDHVGTIGTFTKYRGKLSLNDVGRVHQVPKYRVKAIEDLLIERSEGDERQSSTIADTVAAFPEAQAILEQHPELEFAMRLEGNIKTMGMHPAGLVVSNSPLTDSVAVYERTTGSGKTKKTRNVVSVDKYDAEHLGLMKADFLGLTTMGMLGFILDKIGISVDDLYRIPLDDEKVMKAFRAGDVSGVFQFSGGATRAVTKGVLPDTFMELADINTLSRPGPLYSGSTQSYINIKHEREVPSRIHPAIDEIVKGTQYQIIYQEQIFRVVREIGGFDWEQTSTIRKIIQRKLGEGAFREWLKLFTAGAATHGISESDAATIWSKIVTAGQYVFNAAHAISYAMIGYWTMYFKVYYPLAFYLASLKKYPDQQYPLLRDAISHGILVKKPDRNFSGLTWNSYEKYNDDKGQLIAGIQQLPGIGESIAEEIIRHREREGEFKGWGDLLKVKGLGVSKFDKILDFIETDDPFEVYRIERILAKVRKAFDNGEIGLPRPTHRAEEIDANSENVTVVFVGLVNEIVYRDVIEDQRNATGDDVETIKKRMKDPHLTKRVNLKCTDESDLIVTLRFNRFILPKFSRMLKQINLDQSVAVVKGTTAPGLNLAIRVDQCWILETE